MNNKVMQTDRSLRHRMDFNQPSSSFRLDTVENASESSTEYYYEDLMGQEEIGRHRPAPLQPEDQPAPSDAGILPIDHLEHEITTHIANHRVTIIHGETGCGKSSRVPVMLYNSLPNARMFVSQPRRIAARALATRVRESSGLPPYLVGMRLGHGVRDEQYGARIWFVTTGYLVRLLAHHPEAFDNHTHLIIDEVHERSVDTDILCLLAKRLLETHPTIKLVLMSATIAADMYRNYFSVAEEALFVGSRRFPVTELFAEDLPDFFPNLTAQALRLAEMTSPYRKPSSQICSLQYGLAVQVARWVGEPGSSVLIFVSGMADIIDLTDRFDQLGPYGAQRGAHFKCLPIHSDIPFEEQLEAFKPATYDEVKIIIATNAAESSVTLPDVDHVICLGTCKRIEYNPRSHRSQLAPAWISRASATQRSGRTGRVRSGTAYRLYSRALFEQGMSAFEQGEMHQQPLDAVILSLKSMLNCDIIPVLEDVIEPPDSNHVDRAFTSLHNDGLITFPGDEGQMTVMGQFVAGMGIDLQLGRLIGLGSQFGVLPEAIVLAAGLSLPKSPLRMTNPLIHDDPDQYNSIVKENMLTQNKFDNGVYSTPIMLMCILWEYSNCQDTFSFCLDYSLAHSRMRQFSSTVAHLETRVRGLIGPGNYSVRQNPRNLEPEKLNILRLLLVWTFPKQIISCKEAKATPNKNEKHARPPVKVVLKPQVDGKVDEKSLRSLLKGITNYSFESGKRYNYLLQPFQCPKSVSDLQCDLLNFLLNRNWDLSCAWLIYEGGSEGNSSKKQRGKKKNVSKFGSQESESLISLWIHEKYYSCATSVLDKVFGESTALSMAGDFFSYKCSASKSKNRDLKQLLDVLPKAFQIKVTPDGVSAVSSSFKVPEAELEAFTGAVGEEDIFSIQEVEGKQWLTFPYEAMGENNLVDDLPLGARVIAAASLGYRNRQLQLWGPVNEEGIRTKIPVKVDVPSPTWSVVDEYSGRKGIVHLSNHCLPAVATHQGTGQIFAVSGDMLDLNGGGARAEGVTLLPPGSDWVSLALLCFGLQSPARHNLSQQTVDDAWYFNEACCELEETMCENRRLIDHLHAIFGYGDFGILEEIRQQKAEEIRQQQAQGSVEATVWEGHATEEAQDFNLDEQDSNATSEKQAENTETSQSYSKRDPKSSSKSKKKSHKKEEMKLSTLSDTIRKIIQLRQKRKKWVDLSQIMKDFEKDQNGFVLSKVNIKSRFGSNKNIHSILKTVPGIAQNESKPSQFRVDDNQMGSNLERKPKATGLVLWQQAVCSIFKKNERKALSFGFLKERFQSEVGIELTDEAVKVQSSGEIENVIDFLSKIPGVMQKGPDSKPRFSFLREKTHSRKQNSRKSSDIESRTRHVGSIQEEKSLSPGSAVSSVKLSEKFSSIKLSETVSTLKLSEKVAPDSVIVDAKPSSGELARNEKMSKVNRKGSKSKGPSRAKQNNGDQKSQENSKFKEINKRHPRQTKERQENSSKSKRKPRKTRIKSSNAKANRGSPLDGNTNT